MIITTLWGGLGNQMFQYAAAHNLASNHDATLVLDLGWFRHRSRSATPRRYELGVFRLGGNVKTRAYRPAGKKGLNPWGRPPRFRRIKDKQFTFDDAVLRSSDDVWLTGYWQSEQYFEDVRAQIRDAFSFTRRPGASNADVLRRIQEVESVSLHVRRGDYVSDPGINKAHGAVSLDYYRAAVDKVAAGAEAPYFFVFSDDPQWSRENISTGHPTTYISHNEGKSSFEDMRLMSRCRHHIIANSSFSWWGAWLAEGQGPGQMVVAPKTWFADGSKDTSDLVPDRWIQL